LVARHAGTIKPFSGYTGVKLIFPGPAVLLKGLSREFLWALACVSHYTTISQVCFVSKFKLLAQVCSRRTAQWFLSKEYFKYFRQRPILEYIIRSQKHECRNSEQGRAVSFLGIFVYNFSNSVFVVWLHTTVYIESDITELQ
jgi:hypothetical protein